MNKLEDINNYVRKLIKENRLSEVFNNAYRNANISTGRHMKELSENMAASRNKSSCKRYK